MLTSDLSISTHAYLLREIEHELTGLSLHVVQHGVTLYTHTHTHTLPSCVYIVYNIMVPCVYTTLVGGLFSHVHVVRISAFVV